MVKEKYIYRLNNKFLNDYSIDIYPELLFKVERPYTCLLIEDYRGFYICIPFRSNIYHKNAFIFHNTKHPTHSKSGLDYSKIVLINNKYYFDDSNVVIDEEEYKQTMLNIEKIAADASSYVENYFNHINNVKKMNQNQFNRRYKYSTLKYFKNIWNNRSN